VTVTFEQSKQQFLAGDRVHISANISDEVFAAGREITVEGTRAQSVYLVGATILVKDRTLRDMIAGAHEVEISGTIEDDALIAVCPVCPWGSGRLLVGPQGRIGDAAHLLASTLEIQGTVGGDLKAIARRIVISGSIAGKAELTAKEIVIAPGARLGDELVARSPRKPEIAAGATIAGPVREIETR
jgi:cytoskeletal protein CcmA (bactofilin family)